MKKILKWIAGIIISLLFLWIAAGCFLIFYIIPKTDIKKIVTEAVDKNINSKSDFKDLQFSFFSTFPDVSLEISDLLIYDSISRDTSIWIDNTRIDLNTIGLLQNRLSIKDVAITQPYINFYVDSMGVSNLDSLFKPSEKTTEFKSPIINLNEMSVRRCRIDYHNISTDKQIALANINFDFQGRINLMDSILDVRHGRVYIGDNSFEFCGHIDPEFEDITITYDLSSPESLPFIASIDWLKECEIEGKYTGEIHIEGDLDNSFEKITVSGFANAENIGFNSSKNKLVVNDGELFTNFKYSIGNPDSSFFSIDSLRLNGQFLSLAANGRISPMDSDLYINAHIKANGNLTEFFRQTSILSENEKICGKFKTDIRISSTYDDLLHKYKLPRNLKSLYDLKVRIEIPDIEGRIDVSGLKVANDTLNIGADRLVLSVNGKSSRFSSSFDNLTISRDGKVENTAIKAQNGKIDINGRNSTASVKISEAGLVDVVGKQDSVVAVAHLLDMNFGNKGNSIAAGSLESFTYRRGQTKLFGAKVNGKLLKSSKKSKKPWDTGSIEVYISRFEEKNLDIYCKKFTGSFHYDGNLSGLKTTADSVHLKTGDNELYLKAVNVNSENEGCYRLISKTANTEKVILGLGININNLNALYHYKERFVDVKTGRMTAGKSDFSAYGSIDLSKSSPVLDIDLVGKYLSINDMIVAGNRMNLALGNPNAIPLDSIPQGKLPRAGGKPGKNMTIRLKLDRLTFTTLELSNVTGQILMRDKVSLIDNLQAKGDSYKLCLNTKYTFVNRGFSITDVLLDFKNLEITELPNIIPSFENVSPMLSSLRGTVDLKLAISTPIRYFIGINLSECKAAAALQAKNISIADNETLREVAKTLMFKNRNNITIDSLAVAATISNSQMKIYPFMLSVDRYKVAMYGENDIITKRVDYHISALKSPVPFKFGIDITGIPKYKIKLVKSGYKSFDPGNKPWTNPEYIQFESSLEKPITDFKKLVLN